MKSNTFPVLNGRLAAILLLLALGQVLEIAHRSEHGIADFAERCATCVHLDQPAQAASTAAIRLPQRPAPGPLLQNVADPLERRQPSPFDSRAPPA